MNKTRILIVDDEVKFTRMVKLSLEKLGVYEVREENRAKQALAAARDFRPDLILLDVVMPDADGGDVRSKFADDPELKDIPIIFLTALVDTTVNSAGMEFIAKPVTLQKLTERIQENLKK